MTKLEKCSLKLSNKIIVTPEESDNETIDIDVFPVPSSNLVTIEAEQHMGKVEVIVESMDGKVVKQFFMQSDHEELDISHFEGGTYILKFIVQSKNIENRKIVKI